ncbi:MAG: hypothetical protein HOH95_03205 [Dehalococcoidia bacterium]|jgi:hypothetical protein|nr:hypothetical protein [Dehalococcoidia bacterium]
MAIITPPSGSGSGSGTGSVAAGFGALVLPDTGGVISYASGTGGLLDYGAYSEIENSLAQDSYVIGIAHGVTNTTAGAAQIDIATGAAASEVVQYTQAVPKYQTANEGLYIPIVPLFIAAGSRIAVRIADTGSSALTYTLTLSIIPATNYPV